MRFKLSVKISINRKKFTNIFSSGNPERQAINLIAELVNVKQSTIIMNLCNFLLIDTFQNVDITNDSRRILLDIHPLFHKYCVYRNNTLRYSCNWFVLFRY